MPNGNASLRSPQKLTEAAIARVDDDDDGGAPITSTVVIRLVQRLQNCVTSLDFDLAAEDEPAFAVKCFTPTKFNFGRKARRHGGSCQAAIIIPVDGAGAAGEVEEQTTEARAPKEWFVKAAKAR